MCVIADDRAVLGLRWRDGRRGDRRHRGHHQRVHRVRPISIRSARRAPVAGSTFNPTRASGSSAASIPNSSCLGSSLPLSWCFELCGGEAGKVEIAGKAAQAECPVRVRSRPGQALERARSGHWRDQGDCSKRSASRSAARANGPRRRRPPGVPTLPVPPTSSRRWCGSWASRTCRRRRCPAPPAWRGRC